MQKFKLLETNAKKLAQWVIGITILYPVSLVFVIFLTNPLSHFTIQKLINIYFYFSIPIFVIDWILTICSLKIERKNIGFLALFFTIIYSTIFLIALYTINTVKMC